MHIRLIFSITFFSIIICISGNGWAQSFPGYRSSNYTGVNGAFFNPSSIADNHFTWDANIVSMSAGVYNNLARGSLADLKKTAMDTISHFVFEVPKGLAHGLFDATVHGPSVMFSLNNKSGFALTTSSRFIANAIDWDGDESDQFLDPQQQINIPYVFSSEGVPRINAHQFSQIGVTYARVVQDNEHFIKAGVTLNFLMGTGSAYMQVQDVAATLNAETIYSPFYLENTTGRLDLGVGGFRLSNFSSIAPLTNKGLSANLGFTYEYRPGYDPNDVDEFGRTSKDYQYKIGVAITDIGALSYRRDRANSGSWIANVTGEQKWLYNEETLGMEEDEIVPYLNSKTFLTPTGEYNESEFTVALPMALHADMDIAFTEKLFVNVSGVWGIPMGNSPWSQRYFSNLTITPRYEKRLLSIFLPITYNHVSKLAVGTGLRFGPLFMGTGSLTSALFGKVKQGDFYFGLHLGRFPHQKKYKEKTIREKRSRSRNLGCYEF